MTVRNVATTIALLPLMIFPQGILAENVDHTGGKTGKKNVIQLSADLHRLLGAEMIAIENGMRDLVPAISSGEWDTIATIARSISDSFILKQKLTAGQKEELHRALPDLFIEMDQDFHNSAAMLAHAAGMKNADVVNFYFFKLNNACVACHSRFASERFPGLAKGVDGDNHQH